MMRDRKKMTSSETPPPEKRSISRRRFIAGIAAAPAVFTIVPRHVLGGTGYTAPSETFGGALIGVRDGSEDQA